MTLFPAQKPRDPKRLGCAVCGFPRQAAIHSIPQKTAKPSRHAGHVFTPQHNDGEPEYQSWLSALATQGNKEQA